jgi:hypothetical protein
MTRKELEDYLRARNIAFRQMCCVEHPDFSKGVYDDLTQIGQEEAPWFCRQKNVYVAFQFTGPQRANLTPTANPADVLRAVSVYRWLEGCLWKQLSKILSQLPEVDKAALNGIYPATRDSPHAESAFAEGIIPRFGRRLERLREAPHA